MLTLLVALLLGWRSSEQRGRIRLARQANRLQFFERELARARAELKDRDRPSGNVARAFWETNFDGAHLPGVMIASPDNVFQRASFQDCNLENADLQGGGSSFQFAKFDKSNLVNAKLTGGGASFQQATFVDADLTGAILTGGGASFQGSSFENATLVRARLVGSFQLVNISGTRFEGADLSALDSESLESCYFNESPTYNGQTLVPDGFDPETLLWRRVPD